MSERNGHGASSAAEVPAWLRSAVETAGTAVPGWELAIAVPALRAAWPWWWGDGFGDEALNRAMEALPARGPLADGMGDAHGAGWRLPLVQRGLPATAQALLASLHEPVDEPREARLALGVDALLRTTGRVDAGRGRLGLRAAALHWGTGGFTRSAAIVAAGCWFGEQEAPFVGGAVVEIAASSYLAPRLVPVGALIEEASVERDAVHRKITDFHLAAVLLDTARLAAAAPKRAAVRSRASV